MDNRIADIAEGRPPAPDGKGRYKSRRYGRIDQDPELNTYNDDLADFDEEEGRDSATDDEGDPVQTKRVDAQPEEEEEGEDEGQAALYLPEAASPRNQDAEPLEEEAAEQTIERQPDTSPRTRAATRRGRVSPSGALASKRRRKVGLPFSFPRSRLRLTMRRFRRTHSRFWKNLSLMTSRRPYEVPRLMTSLPRNLNLPPSASNNPTPQQQ